MAAGSPERLFIVIKAPNGDVREVAVGSTRVVVGRDESADVRVEDRKVSRRHAAFVLEDGRVYAEDLGSSNGIRLNGQRIDRRAPMGASDVVLVGGYEVRLKAGAGARPSAPIDPARTKPGSSSPPTVGLTAAEVKSVRQRSASVARDLPVLVGLDRVTEGRRFVLALGPNVVGRQDDATVSVLDGSISRQHARVDVREDGVHVADLESANGVFINGVRVEREMLASGDQLRFGSVTFRVELPPNYPNRVRAPGKRREDPKAKKEKEKGRRRVMFAAALVLLAILVTLGVELQRRHREAEARRRLALQTPSDPPRVRVETTGADGGAPRVDDGGAAGETTAPGKEPVAQRVRTATSPFSRRDERGFPIDLPEVDVAFDFDGFVAARLAEAEGFEKAGRPLDVRRVLLDLSARDPVNADARAMLERIRLSEEAQRILGRVEKLRQKGELMAAYDALGTVPENAPEAELARRMALELRPLAWKDELERANREATSRATHTAAHRRLIGLLEREPSDESVLSLIRTLEAKMLATKQSFDAYVPPDRAPVPTPSGDPAALLAARYTDRVLLRVAETYQSGALDQALENARALARRAKPPRQKEAERLARTFAAAKAKYQRTRTALGNDPAEAWAHLIELETIERSILPAPLQSKLVLELRQGIADEYTQRGEALFTQSRFEDAFQQWVSATKLQPKNGRALAGLGRLEQYAEKEAQEIDLAAQMGATDACERWRKLTRMTRAESEIYKKVAQRVKVACSK